MTLSSKPQNADWDSAWVPAGMPELKVGMKVRWRISSECPYKCEKCGADMHVHKTCDDCQNEDTGIITDILINYQRYHNSDICRGACIDTTEHDYFIGLHTGRDDNRYRGFWAAASELILIEDEGSKG